MSDIRPRAVIDVGTNTLRLLVGSVLDGRVSRIACRRSVTRLGAGIQQTGTLCEKNIDVSVDTILSFQAACEALGVERIVALGTSALREARDRQSFVERVQKATGLAIRVISGDEEAELTVRGVTAGLAARQGGPIRRLIADIGGGSTEWILCDGGMMARGSIPVGVVKLSEGHLHHDPPLPDELEILRTSIDHALSPLRTALAGLGDPGELETGTQRAELIATGGTAAAVAAIDLSLSTYDGDKVHLHGVSLSTLRQLCRALASMTLDERSSIAGLEPERADLIIAGTFFVEALMALAGADYVIVSDYGLLEGFLLASSENHRIKD